ncbi:MAG: hypothetical protein EBS07_06830 [Sphingobacteriia bacterium]|nr:hypothetical protein [Sphingobacteriia bacterium]
MQDWRLVYLKILNIFQNARCSNAVMTEIIVHVKSRTQQNKYPAGNSAPQAVFRDEMFMKTPNKAWAMTGKLPQMKR